MTEVSTTAIATADNAANGTQTEAAKTPRVKNVLEDLAPKSPYFFDKAEDAFAFLAARLDPDSKEYIADFNSYPTLFAGMSEDEEGNTVFSPTVYTGDTRLMFHVLTNRGKTTKDAQGNETKAPATIRALVLRPVPSIAAIENDEAGRAWLNKIINTQIAHTTVAPLRKSDKLDEAANDMPGIVVNDGTEQFDLGSFFAGRETGGAFETYDALYKSLLDAFTQKSPAWKRARLNKAELKKAMESTAYALATYSPLEDRGDKPSLFVMAIQAGILLAKKQGLDPTIFETWLAERNDKTAATGDESEEDFDLDDLDLLAAPADAATDATAEASTPAA